MVLMSAAGAADAPVGERRGRRAAWVPVALVSALAVGVLLWRDVPAGDLASFVGYIGIGGMVPGALLWRALLGGGWSLAADLAAGLAFGQAVEVGVYVAVRAAGQPMLVLVWPVAVIAAFAAVPRLRRHWRLRARPAAYGPLPSSWPAESAVVRGSRLMPVWCAWVLSGVFGYLVVWSGLSFFSGHGLTWPGYAAPYVDMPYHLALVGEIRHHLPPQVPTVLGEPLAYHWFVYAEMAATSWVTGIEPQTLLYRLSVLPMSAATIVLIAVAARRLTGRWWAGAAAVMGSYFLFCPELYRGANDLFTSRSLFTMWTSPTQTFGTLLFAAAAVLLIGCLRGEPYERGGHPRGRWAALAVLLAAVTGAKATFLPLLLGGLVVVLAVRGIVDRRLHRPALAATGITAACLAFGQAVVFGGEAQGMAVAPFATMRGVWEAVTRLPGPPPVPALAGLTAIHLISLACVWAGVSGLAARRAALVDPAVLLLAGMGAAGVGAAVLLGHPAGGQLYFLEGARPYLTILSMAGLAAVTSRTAGPRHGRRGAARAGAVTSRIAVPGRGLWRATGAGAVISRIAVTGRGLWWAAGCGAGVVVVVGMVAGPRLPVGGVTALAVPYLVLVVLAVAAALVWRRAALVVALVLGYAVPSSVMDGIGPSSQGPQPAPVVPAGAMETGRWLRDHSSPGDVVATDAHCRPVGQGCDSRHFWVSGYSERRVLVEGWAYAGSTLARSTVPGPSYLTLEYADRARLAANDEMFRHPSPENITQLVRQYGVKWAFSANNAPLDSAGAKLRFRSGTCSLYELSEK